MAHTSTGIARSHRWMYWAGLAVWALAPGWMRAADAGLPFNQAKITEVVNDVNVVNAESLASQPATQDEEFIAPNLLKTGRRSRAQLTAEDGTVARVGSNSVFSFEPKSRTINLQQGSVLFNSPAGKGGGTIVTNSATATVLGTTLFVVATSNGGFKVLMLEGHGSIQLPGGQTASLTAGQMIFVLPGVTGPNGSSGPPRVGPKVTFDLDRETKGSDLIHGFTATLPSMGKVDDAINTQQKEIQNGTFTVTDKAVVGAIDQNSIVVVNTNQVAVATSTNPNNPNNPNSNSGTPNPAVVAALGTDYDFRSPPIPSGLIFTSPAVVFKASDLGLPNGVIPGNQISITGVIGGTLTAAGETDLSSLDGLPTLDLFGSNGFNFAGSTSFTGLSSTRNLIIFAEQFTFIPTIVSGGGGGGGDNTTLKFLTASGVHTALNDSGKLVIEADFNSDGAATNFELDSISEADFDNVEVTNPTGSVQLGVAEGDANLNNTNLLAGSGDVFLGSSTGSVSVTGGSLLYANGGSVNVSAAQGCITIADSNLQATATGQDDSSGAINLGAKQTISVENGALVADVVNVSASNEVDMDNVSFSTTAEIINMSARTITLANINFASGTIVNLASTNGMLAPNANTGATPVPGDVNFVRNVNYGGQPAQNYVSASRGGTGLQPTTINIGTFGSGLGVSAGLRGVNHP